MKSLIFIMLFLSAGIHAQIKKQEHGKVSKVQKKTYTKKQNKAKVKRIGMKSFKDEEVKRIIDLSQQNDNTGKKELVRKNGSGYEYFDYEETRSSRTRMYLFI